MKDIEVVAEPFKIRGKLTIPEGPEGAPVVIRAPGWMSVARAAHYASYDSALVDAGFAVLSFDYRGLGRSDPYPDPGSPHDMVTDILAVVALAGSLSEIDGRRIGLFGTGGLGAAAAIVAGAIDRRVRAVAAMSPIADGWSWLRDLRTPEQWRHFIMEQEDERSLASSSTGPRDRVKPIGGILVPPSVRNDIGFKSEVAEELPGTVSRAIIDDILMFSSKEAAQRLGPTGMLLISVEADVVVPSEHARELYRLASDPKRWVVLTETTSYQAHSTHNTKIIQELVAFFNGFLRESDRTVDSRW